MQFMHGTPNHACSRPTFDRVGPMNGTRTPTATDGQETHVNSMVCCARRVTRPGNNLIHFSALFSGTPLHRHCIRIKLKGRKIKRSAFTSKSLTCYFRLPFLTIPRTASNTTVLARTIALTIATRNRGHACR